MPTVHTLEFNQTHGTTYTDEELLEREATAEPFKLFKFLGGASARLSLVDQTASDWYSIYRKAEQATGTDDPVTINNWVDAQIKTILGIENPTELAQADQVATPMTSIP